MDIVQEMLTPFNDDTDLFKKGYNWWWIMGVWLWHWNQSPIISMQVSRRAKTEKSTSSWVKCEGFAHCFLRLQWRGALWIFEMRRIVEKPIMASHLISQRTSYCDSYFSTDRNWEVKSPRLSMTRAEHWHVRWNTMFFFYISYLPECQVFRHADSCFLECDE